jgi:hypothetical protein
LLQELKAETVINHLHRIGSYKRNQVENHDMANSMKYLEKDFPKAERSNRPIPVQN